jgi:Domain of unknown function (DUF4349)
MTKRLTLLLLLAAACSHSTDSTPARLIVRSASLRGFVERLDGVENALRERVATLDGFIANSEQSDGVLTVVFRVPSSRLELALTEVSKLASRVDSRQLRGEDFTEEYVDLEAQRVNLTATRARLLALLEHATKVDDALAVNKGLSEVQGQLEHLAGRIKYLEQAAALSTVSVTFEPEHGATDWRPLEVARRSLQGLVSVLQALANLGIAVAVFSPLWGSAWWLLRRARRAR